MPKFIIHSYNSKLLWLSQHFLLSTLYIVHMYVNICLHFVKNISYMCKNKYLNKICKNKYLGKNRTS